MIAEFLLWIYCGMTLIVFVAGLGILGTVIKETSDQKLSIKVASFVLSGMMLLGMSLFWPFFMIWAMWRST